MLPPLVFIALCSLGEVENDLLVFGAGGLIFASGLALRVWAQMHLHYRLKTKKHLTVTGPYEYVRNPVYVANTTMLAGTCILSELLWFVPIQVLYCAIIYTLVVGHEEPHLTKKYGGAYLEYVSRVPRWFPKLLRSHRRSTSLARYLGASLLAEGHNLLLLLPFIIKELIGR
jgi:protein-S-isoprenylcysteine O-methyltransferase Ste14